ncbi:MAG: VWA domain-containing protein [Phycisphaerales bacterium]|nr:MAG: VWA domain-containing protein [Phycisphaerales bacterium]
MAGTEACVLGLTPIIFDRPSWLLLLLLVVPSFLMARRSVGGLSKRKAYLTFFFRCVVIALMAAALSHPIWEKRGKGLTVTVLLDRSQSVPLPLKQQALEFLQKATEAKESRDDRVAVITIAKDASIAAMPDQYSAVTVGLEDVDLTATNLAAGVHLALAIMPADTANRIVLASDGNETVDSVLAAADIARANEVPIDVMVLEYEHQNEVLFEQMIAPARARMGSSGEVRLVLRSQGEASGNVFLEMNGQRLDLNGPDPGEGLHVDLDPGPNGFRVTVDMESAGAQVFDAEFVPDDEQADWEQHNNDAMAVTFVSSEGRVLIIDDTEGAESQHLQRALTEARISADVIGPDALINPLVTLSGYDAVVLANIPRYAFDDEQDRALHDYVHDLGGGLVMLGGHNSFGAGSWMDQEVAKVLPVDLDPPQTRQMVRGALALMLHSCEMPRGNFWGRKVAESAIEALSSLDYVGIIEWGFGGESWTFPMQIAGDKKAALDAAKKLQMGDMPSFAGPMKMTLEAMAQLNAGQKHAIIISDGDASPPSASLLQDFIDARITVTTVMVGGHGTPADANKMKSVASKTGGRFFNVINPKKLPEIFFKEARLVSRSLIQEGDIYQPQVVSQLPGPTQGFTDLPPIRGFVLTAAREGLAQTPIAVASEQAGQTVLDPIYAHWNYGLGKSIAFTSDLTGRWGAAWAGWEQFRAFWEQSIRWVMRPSSPANMQVKTHVDGDTAVVEIEALEADASFLNFLRTDALVLGPNETRVPLSLQQTGPGRYRGEFRISDPGAHLVNISYVGGAAENPIRGTIQAAACVPYAREFRAVKHNRALLEDLADRTGGQVLSTDHPTLVDLFDKQGLTVPESPHPMWDLLAILAASLFVIDVAARRLAIDPRRVAELAGRAVGKRAEATEATVAAWKRAKERASHRKPEKTAHRTRKYEADEADARLAIDVEADTSAKPKAATSPKRRERTEQGEGTADEGDFTSRLLAARRKAQRADEGEEHKDADHA